MDHERLWLHRLRPLPGRRVLLPPSARESRSEAVNGSCRSQRRAKRVLAQMDNGADVASLNGDCNRTRPRCKRQRESIQVNNSFPRSKRLRSRRSVAALAASSSQDKILACCAPARDINIEDLPAEIMLIIFSHLSLLERARVQSVCRRWMLLGVMSLRTLHHVDLSRYFCSCRDESTGAAMVNSRHSCCSFRQRQQLRSRPLTDRHFRQLLARLPNLHKLELGPVGAKLSRNGLLSIGKLCPSLKDLDIRYLRMSFRALENLCRNCPRLQRINVPRLDFREQSLEVVLRYLTELRSLELDTLFVPGDCFHLLPSSIETIELKSCQRIRSSNLQLIGDRCHQLKRLSLSHSAITSDNLSHIGTKCVNLAHLDLISCWSVRLEDCVSHLSSLVSLSIGGCYNISRQSLHAVSVCCTSLQRLDLRGVAQGDAMYNEIPAGALQCIGRIATLVWLDLSYQCHVTDEVLSALAQCPALHTMLLKEAYSSRSSFTEKALIDLLSRANSLCHVDVTSCRRVSAGFYRQLVAAVSTARRLTVVVDNTRIKPVEADAVVPHVTLRVNLPLIINYDAVHDGDHQWAGEAADGRVENEDDDTDSESDERFVDVFADWLWIHNALWGM